MHVRNGENKRNNGISSQIELISMIDLKAIVSKATQSIYKKRRYKVKEHDIISMVNSIHVIECLLVVARGMFLTSFS